MPLVRLTSPRVVNMFNVLYGQFVPWHVRFPTSRGRALCRHHSFGSGLPGDCDRQHTDRLKSPGASLVENRRRSALSGWSTLGRKGTQFPTSQFLVQGVPSPQISKRQGTLRGTLQYASNRMSAYCALNFCTVLPFYDSKSTSKTWMWMLNYLIMKLI